MQVDGAWDRKGLLYNPYMANMLTRRQYYLLQRLLRTDVVSLLEDCNGRWAGAWCMGGGACGDESVVPHKGMLAGPLRMFITRKPHLIGIKLYCVADATWGYVVDMYLYTGVRGRLRRYGTAVRNFDAKNIMKLWASLLPEGTVLCADSFFGSHGLAKELAANKRAFLMMTTRSTYGVTWAGEQVQVGQTAVCTVADFKYSLCVYKNPKVGHKPPRVVPMLTNVWFARKGPPHRPSGREVHPVVAAYRTLSRGVDGVNQMALQMRQVVRQMIWAHAVRAFVLRYAVVNAFATCRQLGVCKETTSMWEWQWQVLRRRYFSHPLQQEVHVPVATQRRRVCHFCKKGRTGYECTGC